jgi:hypothetical protein
MYVPKTAEGADSEVVRYVRVLLITPRLRTRLNG